MIGTAGGTPERPAVFFRDAAEWRAWLEANHGTETEIWMGLRGRHVADRGLTWAEAVPEALCFGWIDSVSQRIDDDSRRQRWTPRKRGSNWSRVNVEHVERLLAEGRMHPAGLAAYEARRPERTAVYSYEAPPELDDAQSAELAAHPAAAAFWEVATPSYRRTAVSWVVGAKQEATRQRRFAELLADCAAGRLVKPQRYGKPPAWLARAAEAAALASSQDVIQREP
jgi:uncharacterized protein YdeI (YjbR/CyaY-like superfamily)